MFKCCRRILFLFLAVAALVSCGMGQVPGRRAVKYVEDILSDPESRIHSLVEGFDKRNNHADIVLIDSPERCFILGEKMVSYDMHDNFDASPAQDHLPDFSGERITSLVDIVFSPYDRFVSAGNHDALREVTAKAAVAALDTVCCLGPYDHEFKSRKPTAKLLVMSSPYMAAFGQFDVDTLFSAIGADVPVVCAAREAVEHVFSTHSGAVIMGFISDSLAMSSAVYGEVFRSVAESRHDPVSRCVQVPFDGSKDPLRAFLDGYSKSGVNAPLSAVVADDFSICADSLRASLSTLLGGSSEESAFYRKLLAKDFEIVDCSEIVIEACYKIMRNRNLFTHNISYPVADAFMTSPEENDYVLIDFDVASLPDPLADILAATAPKTTRMYVQDQYYARGN